MILRIHKVATDDRRPGGAGGWTLPEMLVAVGAGTILLIAFFSTFITLSNTSVAIRNYNDLDQSSRHTLDLMNEDLRNTAVVTNLTYTSVTVTNFNPLTGTSDKIQYWWNSANNTFMRQFNNSTPTVMLTNCDTLTFAGYERVPQSTGDFSFHTNDTGDPTQTKLISVSWRCSRTVLGIKLNTESVQTARICIRN